MGRGEARLRTPNQRCKLCRAFTCASRAWIFRSVTPLRAKLPDTFSTRGKELFARCFVVRVRIQFAITIPAARRGLSQGCKSGVGRRPAHSPYVTRAEGLFTCLWLLIHGLGDALWQNPFPDGFQRDHPRERQRQRKRRRPCGGLLSVLAHGLLGLVGRSRLLRDRCSAPLHSIRGSDVYGSLLKRSCSVSGVSEDHSRRTLATPSQRVYDL